MKNFIYLTVFLFSSMLFSQTSITYKGNGKILNATNQKLSSEEVRNLMATNTQALNLYNSGKTKQTVGNILLYSGISTIAINHFLILQNAKNNGAINSNRNIPYIIGAGLITTAIPIKLGFSKKIKKAVSIENEDLKNPKTGFNFQSTSFISNSNGLGLSITF